MEAQQHDWDSFVEREFSAYVDYLAYYFGQHERSFRQLFIGEKIKSLYDPQLDDSARLLQARDVGCSELAGLERVLRTRLSDAAWNLLTLELDAVTELLCTTKAHTQRVLLIGDCLFLDIVPFTFGDLLETGVSIMPDYAASKNPFELHNQLRKLAAERTFDLVFYSPFSYEFVPAYSRTADWRCALMSKDAVRTIVDDTWSQVRATLDLLTELFVCPIHVHNSSAIIREESPLKRLLKRYITRQRRCGARSLMNEQLEKYVANRNSGHVRNLFILDELQLVGLKGEHRAGAYHYCTELQHPARLGQFLAERYVDLIFVNSCLTSKKVVVCDLDNTLWRGVIGEGEVVHLHDRQRVLKILKRKGVILAVDSKNDPANVHFRGGSLEEEDFVSLQIGWQPKVQSMQRIQSDLNLKTKDFVFIDDRADEIELMHSAFPEVLCLDANDSRTWARLALWGALTEDDLEMDRTLMYKQRELREAFVPKDLNAGEQLAMFAGLNLCLRIARADVADLKRVTELINRTNQFNLEGSRTNLKEVRSWHRSSDHLILTGQASDRFGSMGTICIAVAQIATGDLRLKVFVLSCRVFGYGMECSVMNYLKSHAAASGLSRIVASYRPTQQNTPCKAFLGENGFEEAADVWIFPVGAPSQPDPQWLKVELQPFFASATTAG
jgi:FkbH-like protein